MAWRRRRGTGTGGSPDPCCGGGRQSRRSTSGRGSLPASAGCQRHPRYGGIRNSGRGGHGLRPMDSGSAGVRIAGGRRLRRVRLRAGRPGDGHTVGSQPARGCRPSGGRMHRLVQPRHDSTSGRRSGRTHSRRRQRRGDSCNPGGPRARGDRRGDGGVVGKAGFVPPTRSRHHHQPSRGGLRRPHHRRNRWRGRHPRHHGSRLPGPQPRCSGVRRRAGGDRHAGGRQGRAQHRQADRQARKRAGHGTARAPLGRPRRQGCDRRVSHRVGLAHGRRRSGAARHRRDLPRRARHRGALPAGLGRDGRKDRARRFNPTMPAHAPTDLPRTSSNSGPDRP